MQLIDKAEALPKEHGVKDSALSRVRELNDQYLALLKRSSSKPWRYLRKLRDKVVTYDTWEEVMGSALSIPEAGRLAQLKVYTSSLGMCAIEYGTIKRELGNYLNECKGRYLRDPGAELIMHGHEIIGLKLEETAYQGQSYLTEDPPGQMPYNGFYLYGQCRVRLGMFPHGVGDLVVISPPEDLKYPFIVRVSRRQHDPGMTVLTRVNLEKGLASFTEVVSWASGMIIKRLSRLMPFLSGPLQTFEVVNPMSCNTIRPWFRFSEDVKPPSFFRWRHYITPIKRLYACDRSKYDCLGDDGELYWGICIANVILRDMGRSDLITSK